MKINARELLTLPLWIVLVGLLWVGYLAECGAERLGKWCNPDHC